MRGGIVVPEGGAKPFLGAILCEIQPLAIHRRGRARTCQETVSRLTFAGMGLNTFQGYTFVKRDKVWKNVYT